MKRTDIVPLIPLTVSTLSPTAKKGGMTDLPKNASMHQSYKNPKSYVHEFPKKRTQLKLRKRVRGFKPRNPLWWTPSVHECVCRRCRGRSAEPEGLSIAMGFSVSVGFWSSRLHMHSLHCTRWAAYKEPRITGNCAPRYLHPMAQSVQLQEVESLDVDTSRKSP
ncbi:hypothetical protein PAMA_014104 [Pampus argenteus]